MGEIAFTKVKLPYGWLGNMAPYNVTADGLVYPTSEHAFQAWRLAEGDSVRDLIRCEKSPMSAKMVAKKYAFKRVIIPMSAEDVQLMVKVVRLKVEQHPELKTWLLDTGDDTIIEDCTKRQNDSGLFWGAGKQADGTWTGKNILGRVWMTLRAEYRGADVAKGSPL